MSSQQPQPVLSLDQLPQATAARIVGLYSEGAERRRMFDLGLNPGTIIEAEVRSPLGDPRAYRVRETLVALRQEQARLIMVTPISEGAAQ